jgi:cbb3-type cytochrome oxidase subunit 3
VSKLLDYFHTDWAAMTVQDWAGVIITVGVFIGLVIAFWWALNPKRRKKLEQQKYTILNDDE